MLSSTVMFCMLAVMVLMGHSHDPGQDCKLPSPSGCHLSVATDHLAGGCSLGRWEVYTSLRQHFKCFFRFLTKTGSRAKSLSRDRWKPSNSLWMLHMACLPPGEGLKRAGSSGGSFVASAPVTPCTPCWAHPC